MTATSGDLIPQRWTEVIVDFDPHREVHFRYHGDSVVYHPGKHPTVSVGIEAGAGINLIIFQLESNEEDAAFAGDPFQWVSGRGRGARPMPQPSGIVIQSHSDTRLVLQNINPLGTAPQFSDMLFDFHLLVLCGGAMYASPDPTLINQTSPDPPPSLPTDETG